ncbi:hypothetical protein [Bacteroides finegoldii]|uniref:hypothetical protein n=1 Tax=Bacteroides finegoldii TaxID=338188 RepID=UPI00189C9B0F|nr:hypothetical protein [Bacteroides finegoldii]
MKNLLLLASVLILLAACGQPQNKSVTEPLSVEEVNALSKIAGYEKFPQTYEIIEKTMKHSTTAEKALFVDLSYGRFYRWGKAALNMDNKEAKKMDELSGAFMRYLSKNWFKY